MVRDSRIVVCLATTRWINIASQSWMKVRLGRKGRGEDIIWHCNKLR